MIDQLKTLTAAALIAVICSPVLAQETAPAEGEETTETQPGGDFSAGTPVAPELQAGQPYGREQHGDWVLRCVKAAEEGQVEDCQLYQLLNDANDNAVAEFSISPLPEGSQAAYGASIVVPLMTLLTAQMTLSIDGGAGRRYPFSFCNQAGCVSRIGFSQAEVDQFKRGSSAKLILVPALAPTERVELDVSLTGFTAGLAAADAAFAESTAALAAASE